MISFRTARAGRGGAAGIAPEAFNGGGARGDEPEV